MLIGVLSVQGSFVEHIKVLDNMRIRHVQLRNFHDLSYNIDGLILPGGESTVQGKLIKESGMLSHLRRQINDGLPVLATCAGMILLAKDISNDEKPHLATLPIKVRRNGFGRQIESFYTEEDFEGLGTLPMTFIRAPYVEKVYKDIKVLATVKDRIVAVRYKNQIALSFHPELNDDYRIHGMFIDMAQKRKNQVQSLIAAASLLTSENLQI